MALNRPYPLYTVPEAKDLHHMIALQAEREPSRVAFRFREKKEIVQRTVGDFLSDVDSLSAWLDREGLGQGHVALIAPNSYLWLVVWFAVVSAGGVIVPIDAALPPEEAAGLVAQSDSVCLFTTTELEAPGVRRVSFAELPDMLNEGRSLPHPQRAQDTERLATIVFTSGTTGNSKGVMLNQRSILHDINYGCRLFTPGEGASSLSVLPYHHMFGLVVALMMLFHWRTTVFINTGLKYLLPDFQAAKPKTTMLVPLHLQTFHKRVIQKAKKDGKYKKLRASMALSLALYRLGIDVRKRLMGEVRAAFGGELEYILVGGAALDPYYEREFRAWGIDIITAYGATECSPGIAASRNHFHRDGAVGLAVPGCEIRIAEDGEVLIRGPIVMQGYYKDPEATAEALRDGWYRSGDLGYLDGDGFLYLTGRKKNLIILSDGENVSPEKLEGLLARIPGVEEVMVYGEDDAIVAEIYPEEAYAGRQAHFDAQVREACAALPPSQRVKTVRLRTEEFPKNTSRKILRHKVGEGSHHA